MIVGTGSQDTACEVGGLTIEEWEQTRKKSFDPNADMSGVDQQGAAAPAGALAEHVA